MTKQVKTALLYTVPLFFCFTVARADIVTLPALPLGNTSFNDGISGPGLMYEQVLGYYHSDSSYDANGNNLPGSQRVRASSLVSHLAYISPYKIFGGNYGAEVLVPLVHTRLDIDNGPKGSHTRFGDITFSPFLLQWEPVSLMGKPFWQRANLIFTAPTGSYSKNAAVNTGANLWQVSPHYAFTWQLSDKVEISGRVHYAWFSKNTDTPFGDSIQPGQAIHSNFSVSYAVIQDLRVGIAGYQLQQITDDKINGKDISGSRERVMALGPGVMYSKNRNMFYFNVYQEFEAKNTSEGTRIGFRYIHLF